MSTNRTMPQLSTNGTSCSELFDQQMAVLAAARALNAALYACRPHGRDYQYQPQYLAEAVAEWTVDVMNVDKVMQRADDIAAHVMISNLWK